MTARLNGINTVNIEQLSKLINFQIMIGDYNSLIYIRIKPNNPRMSSKILVCLSNQWLDYH